MQKWLAGLILTLAATAAPACPMCKDSVSNREGTTMSSLQDSYTSNGQNISGGINASVYLMLGALLGVMGLVSRVIYKGMASSRKS
jgi:hypothetical protein